ncbi:MAG: hisK [Anaerosolibacter sp.]|uniref:histidinol-phosphatase HisJ n=1 Tax=Anaerosolibacter sp. TaxID=1872527 RepID=UPI002624B877|nr:histidinol-phosphatase HisJ [Anaerosolibacter sp.]MDF2546933.1 hisK [Anaerosolibacter sp.]
MNLSNYHMHCDFCDGIGEARDYVEEAIKKGFKVIGFSSHAPIPFDSVWTMQEENVVKYLDTIRKLEIEYKDRIEIYTGLEIDYFDGDVRDIFNLYDIDYHIGSVHFFSDHCNDTYYSVDGSDDDFKRTLNEYFDGDIKRLVCAYYKQLIKMIELHQPDVLGHLDVVKKNNGDGRYFSEQEQWYIDQVDILLDVVKQYGTIVEVNTGGITRGYIKEPYPSKWILKACKEKGIDVMVNSDAHSVKYIDGCFDLAYSYLKEVGYREVVILNNGIWEKVGI